MRPERKTDTQRLWKGRWIPELQMSKYNIKEHLIMRVADIVVHYCVVIINILNLSTPANRKPMYLKE